MEGVRLGNEDHALNRFSRHQFVNEGQWEARQGLHVRTEWEQ